MIEQIENEWTGMTAVPLYSRGINSRRAKRVEIYGEMVAGLYLIDPLPHRLQFSRIGIG